MGYSPGESMPKAEALHEAKQWLRSLGKQSCASVRRGGIATAELLEREQELDFSDLRYWAAFVLLGDPD
jgi:CHAT domain-containing protein